MSLHIEQIKARISISSVISKKVTLKNRAAGEFLGLCPFHSEKTPSFTVSDIKGFYHCFGCGVHGDIFSFLIESEGYDYKTALQSLADLAGVELPAYNKEQVSAHKVFYDIIEEITSIYQKNLYSKAGITAMHYIKKRGISDNIIEKYRLGFASPDRLSLLQELERKFKIADVRQAQILTKGEILTDPMRGRLIFPIMDKAGKVIAFGGRVLDQSLPKYLNSAENPLFEKGKILYGFSFAQSAMHKTKDVIVVEGYMDVLALANIDIQNVVAPLGTSLKVEQITNLWQYIDKPTICMDEDEAGQKSSMKIATEILPLINVNKSVKFIKLVGAKDPDELIQKKGRAAAIKIFNNQIDLSTRLLEFYKEKIGGATPEKRASLKQKMESIALQIQDRTLQGEYKYFFRNELYQAFKPKSAFFIPNQKKILESLLIKDNYHLAIAFYIVLQNIELLDDNEVYEELIRIELPNEELDKLRQYVLDNARDNIEFEDIITPLREVKKIVDLQLKSASLKQILMRALELHSIYIVQNQIKDAEQKLITQSSELLLSRLMSLKQYEFELKKKLNII